MLRLLGSLVLGLAVLVAGSQAGDVKDKVKLDKDAPSKDPEPTKDPAKDPRAVKGKVDGVDLKGNSFTLEIADKDKPRMQTFKVTKTTEFWGPRGAKGEGLKDDRMAKGYELIVIASKDGTTAEEVHFPYRKPPEEKKKDKKDKKDKPAKEKKG